MKYPLIWIAGLAIGVLIGILFFHDYLGIYLLILLTLHFINRKYSSTFSKYIVTTVIPSVLGQMLTAVLSPQLTWIYQSFLVPFLTRIGLSLPEETSVHFHSIAAVLPFLIFEPLFLRWSRIPIRGNRSAFMRDILQTPITIDLRFKARQPAVSLSALLPKLLEWESNGLTFTSKD